MLLDDMIIDLFGAWKGDAKRLIASQDWKKSLSPQLCTLEVKFSTSVSLFMLLLE